MSDDIGETLRRAFEDAARPTDASISESVEFCRLDRVSCQDEGMLARWRGVAAASAAAGVGTFEVFGEVSNKLQLDTTVFEDIEGERLSLRLAKARRDGWLYFLTRKGFREALDADLVTAPAAVWVAEPFEPFASAAMSVSPWGGAADPPVAASGAGPERPRKFIRDVSHRHTPKAVEPWLLTVSPAAKSAIFSIWCQTAAKRLAYVLPAEIREVEDEPKVVLKGPRSAPIDIAEVPDGWGDGTIGSLSEATSWIYVEEPRTTETRFLFLNNHLSLAWREGHRWPEGLRTVLKEALVSAREAYGFHLQGETKEALKSLGELRKSIQEDVVKAQAATRDLIGALWRDFAIAGIVLAFRSPVAQQVTGASESLRYVAPATAVLLLLSLLVTVASNFFFALLAERSREDWRKKLYPFVSLKEWKKLVKAPINRTRWIYRLTLPFVMAFYAVAIWYLYSITDPAVLAEGQALYERARTWLGW